MRTYARATKARRLLLGSTAVICGSVGHAEAQPGINNIVPDGRTGTQLSTSGSTTTITTSTVRGATGYNSFSQFQEGAGNTVNLVLPQNTDTLVNVVRDGPALVNGTLNAYKSGQIGGNVVFADSYGLVVGKSGVINTGGLVVATPTREYLDKVINAKGVIDTRAAANLLTGDFPISSNGSVVINGRVNALHNIALYANSVSVPGPETRLVRHQLEFESTVNTKNMVHGGALVVRNGQIQIVAAGSVAIGGHLHAGGSATRGGSIEISAAHTVKVYKQAQITTTGSTRAGSISPGSIQINAGDAVDLAGRLTAGGASSAGGSVKITSPGKITIEKDAKIVAKAPLSSTASAAPLPATIELTSSGDLDLAGALIADGAAGRSAGTIGLNAKDITVASSATLSAKGVGAASAGGSITIKASDVLTVADNAIINASGGTSGDGGYVDLSAANTVNLGTLDIDVGAAAGSKAGLAFIDPANITINGAVTTTDPTYGDGAGDIFIEASNSITLDSGASLNTQVLSNGSSSANSGGVDLTAPNITIDQGASINASAINTANTAYSGGLVQIIAAPIDQTYTGSTLSVTINGTVSGGAIITSANQMGYSGSIILGSTGVLAISPVQSSGAPQNISLEAQSITLQSGSSINTQNLSGGYSVADSGAVSLTAPNITIDQGASINASAINNNTAFNGGAVQIDASPIDKSYTGTLSVAIAGAVSGGAITISANASGYTGSISVGATGQITSTSVQPVANQPQIISLEAQSITLAAGSSIVGRGYGDMADTPSGSVVLYAVQDSEEVTGETNATASIDIAGSISTTGKVIATVDSTANTSMTALADDASPVTIGQLAQYSAIASLFGGDAAVVSSVANSTLTVDGTANISGTAGVALTSNGYETSANPLAGLSLGVGLPVGQTPVTIGVVIGLLSSNVTTNVASGATISSAGAVSIAANNDATLNVAATQVSLTGQQVGSAIVYGQADVETAATVANGAVIAGQTVGGTYTGPSVSVVANNKNFFASSATTILFGNGQAALDIAVSQYNSQAVAHVGSGLGSSTMAPVASLSVEALSNTDRDTTSSSAAVGDILPLAKIRAILPTTGSVASAVVGKIAGSSGAAFLSSLTPSETEPADGSEPVSVVKLAGSISLAESNMDASASISADAGTTAAAPSIYASGDVLVASNVTNSQIRDNSQSSTASNLGGDETSPGASLSSALAINLGQFTQTSEAYIGDNVQIMAKNVAVNAQTDVPIQVTWAQFDPSSAIISQIISHINGNLGVVNDILSSFASANAQGLVAIAGSIDLFVVGNDTTAWVGSGAHITTTDTSTTWTTTLAGDPPSGAGQSGASDGATLTPMSGLDVEADTTSESVNVAGNFSFLTVLKGTSGDGAASVSSGGSLNINVSTSTTTAGIGDGAVVVTPANVNVDAETLNKVVTIAPTSGGGGTVGITGLASLIMLDDATHASISNTAEITAPTVDVTAGESNSILGISGALASSGSEGVGLSNVTVVALADTQAYVGDNSADVSGTDYANAGIYSPADGFIGTNYLNVDATTSGAIMGLSVAASLVSPDDSKSLNDKISGVTGKVSDVKGKITSSGVYQSVSKTLAPAASTFASGFKSAGSTVKGAGSTVGGAAGSASNAVLGKIGSAVEALGEQSNKFQNLTNKAASGFQAAKDGISSKAQSGATSLKDSLNETLNKPGDATQYQEVSISGAGSSSIGVTVLDTNAYLDGATVHGYAGVGAASKAARVDVQAANEGAIVIMSGAAALNFSNEETAGYSVAIAGAFALDTNYDATTATISNSTISTVNLTDSALTGGDIVVSGIGLAVNTEADTGIAIAGSLSVGLVFDSVNASIDSSTVTGNTTGVGAGFVDVAAYDSTNIGIGGADAAFTTGVVGVGLAVTVAVVADPLGGTAASATLDNSTISGFDTVSVEAYDVSRILSLAVSTADGTGEFTAAGAIALNDISPTTSATIDDGSKVYNVATVNVLSETARDAALDAILKEVPVATTKPSVSALNTAFDFVGMGIGLGSDNTGAAIVGLAGVVTISQNALGASAFYGGIGESHTATIDDATVTATGTVTVNAAETSTIWGASAGAAVSTDVFAGLGGLTVDLIENTTTATIGGSDSTLAKTVVSGNDVDVTASLKTETVGLATGLAGSVGIGLGFTVASGDNYDQVTASIVNATVMATDSVTDQASASTYTNINAVSAGVGGDEGVAGAIVFNFDYATVSSSISGSSVTATGNVAVLAANTDSIAALAGGIGIGLESAGEGETEVANVNLSETSAAISNSTVDAQGQTGGLTINDGSLATPIDLVAAAAASTYTVADQREATTTIHGLAVDATSAQSTLTRADATSVGINPEDLVAVGLSVTPVINGLQGSTQATISNSQIDTKKQGGDIAVIAGSHSFEENLTYGLAGSTGAAATGGFGLTTVSRETLASITGGSIGTSAMSAGTVTVTAGATNDVYNFVSGVSEGPVALVGSVLLNVFDETTTAYVYGTSVNAQNLDVTATSESSSDAAVGNVGIGLGLTAAAAGYSVDVNDSTTLAYIGDGESSEANNNPVTTKLNVAGAIGVHATSAFNIFDFIGSGGIGAGADAGTFDANIDLSTTRAGLYSVDNSANEAQSVSVTAEEDTVAIPLVGALGVALGGGYGGSLNLVILKSSVTSEIVASNIEASGTVSVTGTTNRDISLLTAAAAVGAYDGGAGSLALLLVGTDAPSSLSSDLNNSAAKADDTTDTQLSLGDPSKPGYQDASSVNGQAEVQSALNSSATDGITSRVNGSTITASTLNVAANANLETANRAQGFALAGDTGVGAALAFTLVEDTIKANIDAGSVVKVTTLDVTAAAGDLTQAIPSDASGLTAALASNQGIYIQALGGAGALGDSLGAAVGFGTMDNSVSADVAGTVTGTVGATDTATITATDSTTTNVETVGANFGSIALGASVATATQSSQVVAGIAADTGDTADVMGFSTLGVDATESGAVTASGTAGTLGFGVAADGAVGTALGNGTVTAIVGSNATVGTTGGLSVIATASPNVTADSFGVTIAGSAAVGASVATASSETTVDAQVANNVTITGGLTLEAIDTPPTGDQGAYAEAVAGSGSFFLNAQAVVATAVTSSTVTAEFGDSSVGGNTTILASNSSDAKSVATGVNGSFFAVGAVVATTTSTNGTYATVDPNATIGHAAIAAIAAIPATANTPAVPAVPGVPADTADVSIQAIGADTTQADATAGTGGIVTADAAVATVSDKSTTTTTIGAGTHIVATDALTILAKHTSTYQAHADTTNASVVGFSGAAAISLIDAETSVVIGQGATSTNGVSFTVGGPACSFAGCASAIDIEAQNVFAQGGLDPDNPLPNANGSAGGVLNGTAAVSTTTLTGDATITFGQYTSMAAGLDPVVHPGDIQIAAGNDISVTDDTVSLSAGGLVSGAGTASDVSDKLTNSIDVGSYSNFTTQGTLSLTTYNVANVTANAYTSTKGGAALGAAVSTADIVSNQTITIEDGAYLSSFGNMYVTAGEDFVDGHLTNLLTNSIAQSYVQAFVAVPYASSEATTTSNTTVKVGTAKLYSGQNIVLGGYEGITTALTNGTGNGFDVGFIPVTSSNNDSTTNRTSTVAFDGDAQAGVYHDLELTIENQLVGEVDANGKPVLDANGNQIMVYEPLVDQTSGATVAYMASDAFDPISFVSQTLYPSNTGNSTTDATNQAAAMVLDTTLTAGPVEAVTLVGQLYAAGGTVTINADTLSGSGNLKSFGSPTINVVNNSAAYLILGGGAYIPDLASAQINFTGAAGMAAAQTAGIGLTIDNGAGISSIKIANTYQPPTTSQTQTVYGPAIFITQDIDNLSGLVDIENASGSIGQSASINAQQLTINAPNGAYAIVATNYFAGESPIAQFEAATIFPGYDGYTPATDPNPADANDAVNYVANFMFGQNAVSGQYAENGTDLNYNIYGFAGSSGNAVPNNKSTVFFGGCAIEANANCTAGPSGWNMSNNPDGQTQNYIPYLITKAGSSYDPSTDPSMPGLPGLQYVATPGIPTASDPNPASVTALTYQIPVGSPKVPLQTTNSLSSFGGQVFISASVLDVNAPIIAGQPTHQSVAILPSANLANAVAMAQATGQTIDITSYTSIVNSGDALISASYNGATNQISLNNVNASSGGGLVVLQGAIVSTSTLGNITINGGLGQVAVTNESGIPLVVNNINTGNTLASTAISSRIEIIDTLQQTPSLYAKVYVNNPATGTTVYDVPTAAALDNLTPSMIDTSASATSYATEAGARVQWVEQATATQGTDAGTPSGTYTFTLVQGNAYGFAPTGDTTPLDSQIDPTILQKDATASTVTDTSLEGVAFQEQITGGISPLRNSSGQLINSSGQILNSSEPPSLQQYTRSIVYHSCDNGQCTYSFSQTSTASETDSNGNPVTASTPHAIITTDTYQNGSPVYVVTSGVDPVKGPAPGQTPVEPASFYTGGYWHYNYVNSVWIKITDSVKADNPIGINFVNNQTASLNVSSNSTVTLNGRISNPNGLTTINASAGDIDQSPAATGVTTITKGFDATASGAIGSVASPISLQLTGGTLAVDAGSAGIVINASSPIVLDHATAMTTTSSGTTYGDVSLTATGSITSPAGAIGYVVGDDVSLTSTNGTIGTSASPIDVTASGAVNAQAYGDVNLANVVGDLRVGTIASTYGDVYLSSAGSVLDAANQTSAETLTMQQVQTIANLLGLTAAGAAAKANQAQSAFIAQINNDQVQVRALLANGTVTTGIVYTASTIDATTLAFYRTLQESSLIQNARASGQQTVIATPSDADVIASANKLQQQNGTFVLSNNPATLQIYQGLANAYLAAQEPAGYTGPAPVATAAQVAAYANTMYQNYAATLSVAYGTTSSSSLAASTSWQAAVKADTPYTASTNPTLLANFAIGTKYQNLQQLTDGVDLSALQPAETTVGTNAVANVAGRNVTITAEAGTVGQLGNSVPILISALQAGTLTDPQVAALAVATTPGSVTVSGTGPNNGVVDPIDLSNVPAGVTPMTLNVSTTAPLFINATGTINVSSTGTSQASPAVYLQSTQTPNGNGGTMTIGSITTISTANGTTTTAGAVSLVATDSIVAASGTTGAVITTGDLTLAAGTGNIGSSASPLMVDVTGTLLAASAAKDVYLTNTVDTQNNPTGDLSIGRVYAGGTASLTTPGAIDATLVGVAIAGNTIDLSSGGNLNGYDNGPFEVQVGAGGVNGTIGGSASIYAPGGMASMPYNLQVGTLTVVGPLTLTADNGIELENSATSQTGGVSATAQTITMDSGSVIKAAQAIDLFAKTGNVTLGQLVSMAVPTAAQQTEISVIAVGTITTNGDDVINAMDHGLATFAAASVGTPAAPIVVETPFVTGAASQGGVYIRVIGDTDATTLSASNGAIQVAGTGALTIGAATSGGSQLFVAQNDLDFGNLTTTGLPGDPGNVTLVSNAGSIHGGSISAAGTIVGESAGSLTGNTFTAGTAIDLLAEGAIEVSDLQAPALDLDSATALLLGTVNVTTSIGLQAPVVSVGDIVHTGGVPLVVTLTGFEGGIGQTANLYIDSPSGVVFDALVFDNTSIRTTANNVSIYNGYVPGSLTLFTPERSILLNDQSSGPQAGFTNQMYAPGYGFSLVQTGYGTLTDAYVVRFDTLARSGESIDGAVYLGENFVQDIDALLFNSNPANDWADQLRQQIEDDAGHLFSKSRPITKVGPGPAVNLKTSDAR